ncbi:MAG: 50S ribosome-binding GTPase [Candidatus Moduliflexus flocculans]|nr:50S ribosome-binding GTPase [Candidatus Moduliflexus flocculans]
MQGIVTELTERRCYRAAQRQCGCLKWISGATSSVGRAAEQAGRAAARVGSGAFDYTFNVASRERVGIIPLRGPLLRGERRPRVALVGRRRTGKSTIFQAAASPAVRHERLAGVGGAYEECVVDVGLDQISLVDLPDIESLHRLREHDRIVLMYLLWGDRWPAIAGHEAEQPTAAFPAPDVLVQVVDATSLEQDLELSLELSLLGRPLVIALNRMDEARQKGLYINVAAIERAPRRDRGADGGAHGQGHARPVRGGGERDPGAGLPAAAAAERPPRAEPARR